MKVIGAGFGRTGTTSLKAALEKLGFGPCYHMTEVFAHPRHETVWGAAGRGEPADLEAVLEGYEATLDWPACAFYEELMERHPEAKVLLSVRDPERWYESTQNTIYELTLLLDSSRTGRLIFGLATLLAYGGFAGVKSTMPHDVIWDGTFDGRFEDKAYAIEVFERHNEDVKRRVPPDRLLVYEVKEGWGPLCEFLGVPEPEEPFPRLNDTAQMRRGMKAVRMLDAAVPGAGRTTMGQCRPAATMTRAIPASHTGMKKPVCSMARPPKQTPRKAPTWWLKNTIPKRVPRLLVPNGSATPSRAREPTGRKTPRC